MRIDKQEKIWYTDNREIRAKEGIGMEQILNKKGFICDMDGVIYHGNKILDGVRESLSTG